MTTKQNDTKKPELTEAEMDNLVRLVELLIEIDQDEKRRVRRLETEPKGFSMAGEGRCCSLCGRMISQEDGWYDKWGLKCMNCQKAVGSRKIPGSLCRDYKNKKFIPDTSLAYKLGVRVQSLRKLIREGKIIGRPIPGGPYLILRKDNPNLSEIISTHFEVRT